MIERERPAALRVTNACPSVAKEKPPHVSHARLSERCESGFERLACAGPADAAFGAPRIRPKIDSVMDPGQICADQERTRTIIKYRVHAGPVRSRCRSIAGKR